MIFLYLILGALIMISYDLMPLSHLNDLAAPYPPRPIHLAAAVIVWCAVVVIWPLAVGYRANNAIRERFH